MLQMLLEGHIEPYYQARLQAMTALHSGDWLHAVAISVCGLRVSDEAVRVAVGADLYQARLTGAPAASCSTCAGLTPCQGSATQAKCDVTNTTMT